MANIRTARKNEIITGAASASMNANFFSVNKTPAPNEIKERPDQKLWSA